MCANSLRTIHPESCFMSKVIDWAYNVGMVRAHIDVYACGIQPCTHTRTQYKSKGIIRIIFDCHRPV